MAATTLTPEATGLDHWTPRAIAVVALCFAINMADGIDVTILSFIAPRVQADWSIGADVLGTLFSAGLLGMAIGGMFIAPLADRFYVMEHGAIVREFRQDELQANMGMLQEFLGV